MMDPAATISRARANAGLTQAELAARSGTSQAAISAYERGRKQPSLGTLGRLLAASGARLTVTPAPPGVREPADTELSRVGRELVEVLELAAALPVRHQVRLRFPRLDSPLRAE